jgi:hypothetical protein
MKFIHSCLEFLSVSIKSSNCLTSPSPSANLSGGFGTAAFYARAVPSMAPDATINAMTTMTHTTFVRLNIVASKYYVVSRIASHSCHSRPDALKET